MNKQEISKLKVAIVHDAFNEFGGAERVTESLYNIFDGADVYTSVINKKRLLFHWQRLKDWRFKISWFGKIPIINRYLSFFRFLAPYIWESFDFSTYDLVISSSGWFMSKGIITRPETIHISYVHHQNKYLTYYETPNSWKNNFFKRIYGYVVGTPLRMWDYLGSQRPDIIVTNSEETKKRIKKFYRRGAHVIHPPVYDPQVKLNEKLAETKDYYINVNRLAKPKHVEVLVKVANKMGIPLYIVGGGHEYNYLKSIANKNVILTGEISDIERSRLYLGAKGFLFASEDEEFGIAPVEAMMYGIPVIAYKSGGLKEIVKDGFNGYLVESLEIKDFISIIKKFEKSNNKLMSTNAYKSAKKYTENMFRKKILQLVMETFKNA
jgi:glycosyltransferase involved in cell wall biosynthesis